MSEDNIDTTQARAKLERAVTELDDLTVARLRAARRRVLAATQARQTRRPIWWVPLSAAAAVAVIALSVVTLRPESSTTSMLSASTDDVDWLLVKDNPDFFNDLEFYRWLEDEADSG